MHELRKYVKYNDKHRRDFIVALATKLDCSESTVWRWLSGKRKPLGPMRKRIAKATRGAVTVEGWSK